MPHRFNRHIASASSRLGDDARCRAGFTIAELLVVVAIVGVLVAVAIPVFTSQLEKAQEATCEANRRSLKGVVTSAYLLDRTKDQQALFAEGLASLQGEGGAKLCPLGGTYSLEGDLSSGRAVIKCSKHGLTAEDEVDSWIAENGWTNAQDSDKRAAYAKAHGIETWPSLEGTDGKTVYLQFKTYGNSSSTAYLYAGPAQSVSDKNAWRANYLCDSTGLFGQPGQWYKLPKEINLGSAPSADGSKLKAQLAKSFGEDFAATLEKVNLVGGKFEPLS